MNTQLFSSSYSPLLLNDRHFLSFYQSSLKTLKTRYPDKIFEVDRLQDTHHTPLRKDILRQISTKLSAYYGGPIDAISWFLVLYFPADYEQRITFRHIEEHLRKLGITHRGRQGKEAIYTHSSIRKLLQDSGWIGDSSPRNTDLTVNGLKKRNNNTQMRHRKRLQEIVDGLVQDDEILPKRHDNESLTSYGERLLLVLETRNPNLSSMGTRLKARVCAAISGEKFTKEHFRKG